MSGVRLTSIILLLLLVSSVHAPFVGLLYHMTTEGDYVSWIGADVKSTERRQEPKNYCKLLNISAGQDQLLSIE